MVLFSLEALIIIDSLFTCCHNTLNTLYTNTTNLMSNPLSFIDQSHLLHESNSNALMNQPLINLNTPLTPHSNTFDYQTFISLLKEKKSIPLMRIFKSFLKEYTRGRWNINQSITITLDFITYFYNQLVIVHLIKDQIELDYAREGVEKLIFNRIYQVTFGVCDDDIVLDECML